MRCVKKCLEGINAYEEFLQSLTFRLNTDTQVSSESERSFDDQRKFVVKAKGKQFVQNAKGKKA